MEGQSKKDKRTYDTDISVVIVGRVVEVEEGIRGIHGNGKNTIKINFRKQQKSTLVRRHLLKKILGSS